MTGRLSKAFVRGDRLVQVFGKGAAAAARQSGNYIWFRGASLRFGRLTMSDADLKLIDMDPRDPFDFCPHELGHQIGAGYVKVQHGGGLKIFTPDYGKIEDRADLRPDR